MSFGAATDSARQCTSDDYPTSSGPSFSWSNSPQLIAFTFEGPIIAASIEQFNSLKQASSKPIPSTWFASGSTIDVNALAELASNGVEFGALATTTDELASALHLLNASSITNVTGFRGAASASLRAAGLAAGLVYDASLNPRHPFTTWPFTLANGLCSCHDHFKGASLTCPPTETTTGLHVVPVIAALAGLDMAAWMHSFSSGFAANYNQKRVPLVVSLTDLIKQAGASATIALVKETLAYEEVRVVSVGQVSALLRAASQDDADAILARPVRHTDVTTPADPTAAPGSPSSSTSAATSTDDKHDPSTGSVAATPSPPTSTPDLPAAAAASPTSTPATTSAPGSSTLTDAPRLNLDPAAADATNAPDMALPAPTLPTPPTLSPTGAPIAAPVAASSSSSGTYVWVVSVGGAVCALFVFVAYRTFGAKDRFPPVITNGYAFESEDRDIYDLESQRHESFTNVFPSAGADTDVDRQLDMLSLEPSVTMTSLGEGSEQQLQRPTFPTALSSPTNAF